MDDWFTLERIDEDTDILSEYRHWEETHCYLLRGRERSLLIDTGLGICDIRQAVDRLTDRPVAAVATHIHWDHIGGHRYFPEFYAHEAELNWLSGGFPLSVEAVRAMVADRCCLPEDFDVSRYTLFQGHPARVRGTETASSWAGGPWRCATRRATLLATCVFGRRSGAIFFPEI